MTKDDIKKSLQAKNLIIPIVFFEKYRLLGLTSEEFLFIVYLHNQNSKIIFDPAKLAKAFGMEIKALLSLIDSLLDKKVIELISSKNKLNIIEESISLDRFYDKISALMVKENSTVDSSNIYGTFEKEFGRTISPTEYQLIGAWLESGFSEEIIVEALKEAVYNGICSIKYIDRILFDWKKKGIKNQNDLISNKRQDFKKEQNEEPFDYNWLEDYDHD